MKKFVKAILMFVLAAILLVLGVISIPQVTPLGTKFIFIICGALIFGYVYSIYLINKLIKSNSISFIIYLVGCILMTMIGILTIIKAFVNIPIIKNTCFVIGLIFWIRGLIEILSNHFKMKNNPTNSKLIKVIINLVLIIVGTVFIINPFITNNVIIYVFSSIFITFSIGLIVLGILQIKK